MGKIIFVCFCFFIFNNLIAQDTLWVTKVKTAEIGIKKRMPPLVSDRPGLSVSSLITPRKHFIIEFGLGYEYWDTKYDPLYEPRFRDDILKLYNIDQLSLKYGISNRTELLLYLDANIATQLYTNWEFIRHEWGNHRDIRINLGFKTQLLKEGNYNPQISAGILTRKYDYPLVGNLVIEKNFFKKHLMLTSYSEVLFTGMNLVFKTTLNVHKHLGLFTEQATVFAWNKNYYKNMTYDFGIFIPYKTIQFDVACYKYEIAYNFYKERFSNKLKIGLTKLF